MTGVRVVRNLCCLALAAAPLVAVACKTKSADPTPPVESAAPPAPSPTVSAAAAPPPSVSAADPSAAPTDSNAAAPPAPVGAAVATPPPPPAAIVEGPRPPPPPWGAEAFWIEGHYRWDGVRYIWERGHWERRPRAHAVWIPPHWERRGAGHVFIPGYWR